LLIKIFLPSVAYRPTRFAWAGSSRYVTAAFGPQGNVVTDIFREVDEDLKRDQAIQLWKRYGKYVIAFAVATVLATAGIVAWQNYREKQRASEGRAFALAMELVNRGDAAAASTAMGDIVNQGGGYRTLALLQEAGLKLRTGSKAAAAAIYDGIAADGDIQQPFRDLATILSALTNIDTAAAAATDKKIQPLLAPGSAFRPSALELEGLLALKQGDSKAAKKTFQELADDTTAPGGLRQRATQILTWIDEQGGA